MRKNTCIALFTVGLIALLSPQSLLAQRRKKKAEEPLISYQQLDSSNFTALKFRNIGPFRGGRCVAVSGVSGQPLTYYMGSTGGGVWKTTDAGQSWKNISDGYFRTGSVGDIAVSQADPNVIYVGMGEHPIRGVMTSFGDGVYRSVDAGQSWHHVGLDETRHISDVVIHPDDPDWVYVAAQGAAHGPSAERGIYRSQDGGKTWEQVLFVDENTGASGLAMDPSNPRILYAATWQHTRYPWTMESGGPGSGIYKSKDGGDTWEKLSEGLPELMGKIAVSVSPVNPSRLWANIEAEQGGVYRSDDGGKKWTRICADRVTQARSWYYMEIFADPQSAETVYVLNAPMLKSIDGGRSFKAISNPHSDQHDLWINPENPQNMILGNDGGACITFNGGKAWSTQQNQATAQFYRLSIDRRFPYYLYAGQQDNSTVAVPSRTLGSGIGWRDWYPVAGGESAFLAFDEDDPRLVYGGSYQGNLSVYDHTTGQQKDVMAYPTAGLSALPSEMKYRFNWNAPLVMSQQGGNILYHGAQMVLKSEDGGHHWVEISGDLTRNEKDKQGLGGGPITNEGAGGENYNTLMYLALSPHDENIIWAGSDEGLLHRSEDGKTWENVPPNAPEGIINSIELSPHQAGVAYVTLMRYKFNDLAPYAYRTRDAGKTWEMITEGFEKHAFPRVIREDRQRPGLLYAGTETGLYLSTDSGEHWQPFQLNLPVCPILDLGLRDNDLVVATSGRAFWILDDVSAIQQISDDPSTANLIIPKPTVRVVGGGRGEPFMGKNPPSGMIIDYFLPDSLPDSVSLELTIHDSEGSLVRSFSSEKDPEFKRFLGGPSPEPTLDKHVGLNRFVWDLRADGLPAVNGVLVLGDYRGAIQAPGSYRLHLSVGEQNFEAQAELLPDPRLDASEADFARQAQVLRDIEAQVIDIHQSVSQMRRAQSQVKSVVARLKKQDLAAELIEQGEAISEAISTWEEALIQPKTKTFQDVVNFPNQLNAEFLTLKGRAESHDPHISAGIEARLEDLKSEWQNHQDLMNKIIEEDIESFNKAFASLELPAIWLE